MLQLLISLLTGRSGEERRLSAREERIARDERRDLVRAALRSAAAHGYYVFENLMTEEAGMIDFLAVGPVGACAVVVRDDGGNVTADKDGTLYYGRQRFADDPIRHGRELADDVNMKLTGRGAYCYNIICFTRAELFYLGDDPDTALKGVCPTWDLPLSFAEAEEVHTPADVGDLADHIRLVYGQPPFVVPGEEDS